MPVTEAERVEQCRNFKQRADYQHIVDLLQYSQRSELDTSDYEFTESRALLRRLRAMKCPGYGWFS